MSEDRCDELFESTVDSVGIKQFAGKLDLSTRQVHRMLNGSQPNPIRRFCELLEACEPKAAEAVLSYVCRELGVYWIRVPESIEAGHVNAVRESAEAIVAITEGRPSRAAVKEIREAIAALAGLEKVFDAQTELTKAARATEKSRRK
jgi:hypothetical protein